MGILNIREAVRAGSRVVIGISGPSGSGKTFTALKIARGMVESPRDIGFLDTENRRGSLYADILDGKFLIADLYAPFSPNRYRQAIEEFQAAVRVEHPHMVHFDHDLGNEYHWNETHPMNEDGTSPDEHEILYDKFQEMTGYHAAKWLVDYCMINELPLPRWNVHSMNVVGAKNIRDYLTLAERHLFS